MLSANTEMLAAATHQAEETSCCCAAGAAEELPTGADTTHAPSSRGTSGALPGEVGSTPNLSSHSQRDFCRANSACSAFHSSYLSHATLSNGGPSAKTISSVPCRSPICAWREHLSMMHLPT